MLHVGKSSDSRNVIAALLGKQRPDCSWLHTAQQPQPQTHWWPCHHQSLPTHQSPTKELQATNPLLQLPTPRLVMAVPCCKLLTGSIQIQQTLHPVHQSVLTGRGWGCKGTRSCSGDAIPGIRFLHPPEKLGKLMYLLLLVGHSSLASTSHGPFSSGTPSDQSHVLQLVTPVQCPWLLTCSSWLAQEEERLQYGEGCSLFW